LMMVRIASISQKARVAFTLAAVIPMAFTQAARRQIHGVADSAL